MKRVAVALFIYLHATQFGLLFGSEVEEAFHKIAGDSDTAPLFVYLRATKFDLVFSQNEEALKYIADNLNADDEIEGDPQDEIPVDKLRLTPGWKYLDHDGCGLSASGKINRRANVENFKKQFSGRIAGGIAVAPGSLSGFVKITVTMFLDGSAETSRICGGAVISKKHILTTAHCVVDKVDPQDKRKVTSKRIQVTVSYGPYSDVILAKNVVHENYTEGLIMGVYDIALLLLEKDLEFNGFVAPMCLPLGKDSNKTFAGETGTVPGWDQTAASGQGGDTILAVQVPIVDNKDCLKIEPYPLLKSQHMCAGGEEAKGTCSSDIGSPLVVKGANTHPVVVGLSSFGTGGERCGVKDRPKLFTRVTSFLYWIMSNMT